MIEVAHLTKQYGPRFAVDDLSFDVAKGEVVGFLGPNGAGKSTTMKIITGFMPASSGSVKVAGFDVSENPLAVKKEIGFLPETPPVYLEMQVADYVEYVARLHDVPRPKLKASVDLALEKTRLEDVRHRIIGNLSKGYRQRVGLAQAIVHNPQVLVLDEPTVGLDPKQIIEIRTLIKGLAGEHTVVLSSHILPEVTATCQRIIVINKGKIVAKDSIENLTSRMNQGQTHVLVVRDAKASGIDSLRSLPGVQSVSAEGQKLWIAMKTGSDAREGVVETAVNQGMGVLEFSPEKLSLEEVFVQLTTQENL